MKRTFSVAIIDEAQDCRFPEVRSFLDSVPARRQLFFSAAPFQNIPEFCYFAAKLTGKQIHQVKGEINSATDLHAEVTDQLKQITAAGGMVHREFPLFGNVHPAELLPVSAETHAAETQLVEGYGRLIERRDLRQHRKLKEDLAVELNTASDATKVNSVLQQALDLLSQNKKVIVTGDDLPVASRILKEQDGLPKVTAGFLSELRQGLPRISTDILFARLREMEHAGVIQRKMSPTLMCSRLRSSASSLAWVPLPLPWIPMMMNLRTAR